MKNYKIISFFAALIIFFQAAHGAITLNFYAITNNYPGNPQIGENQFFVDVDQFDSNKTSFKIYNTGPEPSIISKIYFDDYDAAPSISSIHVVNNGPGTNYAPELFPGTLPGHNNALPAFEKPADLQFSPQVQGMGIHAGINEGEYVTLILDNYPGFAFNDIVSYISSDQLRLGIHAQSFGGEQDTGSEAFVTYYNPIPAPSAILLGAIGTGLVTYLKRNKVLA